MDDGFDDFKPPSFGSAATAKVAPSGIKKQRKRKTTETLERQNMPIRRVFTLLHRLAIFVCAVFYVVLELQAVSDSLDLLGGKDNPRTNLPPALFNVMCRYCGNRTITESPLVVTYLRNSTASLPGTVYLNEDSATFTPCSGLPAHKVEMYSNDYLRELYDAITIGVDYAEPDYGRSSLELIAPVIDCTDTTLRQRHANRGRFNFIVRRRNESDRVYILLLSLSNQEYMIPGRDESGPAAVAILRFFDDMQAKTVWNRELISRGYPFDRLDFRAVDVINTTTTGLWTTRAIPRDEDEEATYIQTASRVGFYRGGESDQSNINYQTRLFEQNPCWIFTRWRYSSQPVLKDSWAWAHFVHLIFAASTTGHLVLVSIAIFHSICAKKLWIGDAFLSFSRHQISRGLLVLFSWWLDGFWALRELAQHDGRLVADLEHLLIYEGPVHSDLLTLFLSACGGIGLLLDARVDPLVAFICFEIGYQQRLGILQWFSTDFIKTFAANEYVRGESTPSNTKISPMQYWTYAELDPHDFWYILQCLVPIFCMLSVVLLLALVHKTTTHIQRHKKKGRYRAQSVVGDNDSPGIVLKSKQAFTRFEIATGVDLESCYGLLCDYEGCVLVQDARLASADGIFTSGFVIANNKFLLQTRDVWVILLMKIIRQRYMNVYVYEIEEGTVKQTARLVFPDTLSFADLIQLDVHMLS